MVGFRLAYDVHVISNFLNPDHSINSLNVSYDPIKYSLPVFCPMIIRMFENDVMFDRV